MSNMSYCRWQNTLQDLRDCLEHIDDKVSEAENKARIKMVELFKQYSNYDEGDFETESDEDEESE